MKCQKFGCEKDTSDNKPYCKNCEIIDILNSCEEWLRYEIPIREDDNNKKQEILNMVNELRELNGLYKLKGLSTNFYKSFNEVYHSCGECKWCNMYGGEELPSESDPWDWCLFYKDFVYGDLKMYNPCFNIQKLF